MDPNDSGYSLKASGRSDSSSLHLTGREPFPPIDEHLVVPEVTRDEIISGRRVVAFPALAPHADQQSDLDYVLRAHVAPGYVGSADLLTRHAVDADFATDACVRKAGVDPATGSRYLEEIAFEVVSEQREQDVQEKAVSMHRRGVRRIFAISSVKGPRRVREWAAESRSWRPLAGDAQIEDPCLVKPLPVAALLDAAAADNAVVEALAAKGNPEIRKREAAAEARGKAQGEVRGKAQGKAEAILSVLETRGIAVTEAQREEILRCGDLDRLDRWLRRATLASSAGEVVSER
ncbi:MAG: hypothetical protein WAM82_13100 [Thermoanaerobaculia bacterium]